MEAARRHRVLPLVQRNLEALCPRSVPSQARERLRRMAAAGARRSLALAGELLRVLRLFEAHGIAAVPIKGPALAESVYGDLTLRSFDDLDICVPAGDVFRARRLLMSRGSPPREHVEKRRRPGYLAVEFDLMLIKPRRRACIELHWEMSGRYAMRPMTPGFSGGGLSEGLVAGRRVHVLSPEQNLLLLCHHACRHCWQNLEMVASVAALLDRPGGIDWARLWRAAGRLRGRRIVLLGLFLARDMFAARLPQDLARQVLAVPRTGAAQSAYRTLLRVSPEGGGEARYRLGRLHLQVRERRTDRVRYALRVLCKPTVEDFRLFGLPRGLGGLRWVLRPLRLGVQFVGVGGGKTPV